MPCCVSYSGTDAPVDMNDLTANLEKMQHLQKGKRRFRAGVDVVRAIHFMQPERRNMCVSSGAKILSRKPQSQSQSQSQPQPQPQSSVGFIEHSSTLSEVRQLAQNEVALLQFKNTANNSSGSGGDNLNGDHNGKTIKLLSPLNGSSVTLASITATNATGALQVGKSEPLAYAGERSLISPRRLSPLK